jgi:hypothetical protein
VNLQSVRTILQVVGHARHRSRQFARLAHGHESRVQPVGQRRPKDESARLNAQHQVDLLGKIVRRQSVDHLRKTGLVFEQRGYVVKENSRLGKIRNSPHQLLEIFHIDMLDCFRHWNLRSLNQLQKKLEICGKRTGGDRIRLP